MTDAIKSMLDDIQAAALDESQPITTSLRKCIALGGLSGSQSLRDWATRELKGYGPGDGPPDYRTLAARICLDGTTRDVILKGQSIGPHALPPPANESVREEVVFREALSIILESAESARRDGSESIRIGLPLASTMVSIMNAELAAKDPFSGQHISDVYWQVHVSGLLSIADVVRTNVVELVADLRLTMIDTNPAKTRQKVDQAVSVHVYGKAKNISINQIQANDSTVIEGEPTPEESWWHKWTGWIIALAAVASATAAFLALH